MKLSLGMVVLSGVSAWVLLGADAEPQPPTATYPLKVPTVASETAPAQSESNNAVTQPFRPAHRVMRSLPTAPVFTPLTNLVFDAEIKELKAEPLQFDLKFSFSVTNVSEVPVVIGSIRTSCGCTVAESPDLPWRLLPNEHGSFDINMDLRGKRGSITKSVFLSTDFGSKTVYVRGVLPDAKSMTPNQREQNQLLAKADRQAVFKGDCASCHATPVKNKTGSQLFEVACNICHGTAHRAEMVPDLMLNKPGRDYDYWKTWIAEGKEGTLMPAFAKEHGGPLTDAQIMSLAHWLTREFPSEAQVQSAVKAIEGTE